MPDVFSGKWVMKYPTGEYVGLDSASGGYPYKVTLAPHAVEFWNSFEEAWTYSKHFPDESWTIHQVNELSITLAVTENDL